MNNKLFAVHDSDHFIVVTDTGFRLHETKSCKLLIDCNKFQGGLSLCQPYRNSNIFIAVGSGQNHNYPTDKMIVWDDESQ